MKTDNNAPNLTVAIGERPDGKTADGNLDAAPAAAQNVDSVPLDVLAMPDETEQMQPPAVGDEVNYQVTGKVVSIDGNTAKVQRTAINGQDLDGDNDAGQESPDEDAAEGAGLRAQAGGMGMAMALLLFLGLLFTSTTRAQNVSVQGSANLTNAVVAETQTVKLYAVTGYNSSASVQYLSIFQTNAIPANGATPLFSFPIQPTAAYYLDFSFYGADLDGVVVAISTTTPTLTLAPANTSIQVITKSR